MRYLLYCPKLNRLPLVKNNSAFCKKGIPVEKLPLLLHNAAGTQPKMNFDYGKI